MVNPAKTADDSCERVSQSAAEWGENQSGQTQLENPTVSRKPKQTIQLSRFPVNDPNTVTGGDFWA